ncbi:hypothetical protein ILUMI_22933, partial [Ignelater luminosus]
MDKTIVIILKGSENWPVWKFRTVIALKAKKLYDVVENPRDENVSKYDLSKWIKRDQLTQDFIVAKMNEGLINHILNFDTVHIWQKLLTVYDKKSEVKRTYGAINFFNYEYEGQGLAAHVSSLENIRNQLEQLDEDMSDRILITKMLMTLPNEFSHFASAWESVDKNKQTLNKLMLRLLIEEECIKSQGADDKRGVFVNLFSISTTVEKALKMSFNEFGCRVFDANGNCCATSVKRGKLFEMQFNIKSSSLLAGGQKQFGLKEWQQRLAHQNFRQVRLVLKRFDIDFKDNEDECCASCLERKQHRFPFYSNTTKYNNVGEM